MNNTVVKRGLAVATSGAMEAETISKHGRMMKIQKSITKLSVAIFAICALVSFGACKSKAPSVEKGAVELTAPLSEPQYQSNKDFFRATQSAKGSDISTAKSQAILRAKTLLSSNIQSTIKAVLEDYTNQRTVGDQQEFENKFESISREVVNQTINDVRINGEKLFKEADGKYTYWINVEMSKDALANKLSDRLSNDAKTKLDFDQHRFRQILDDEMEKMNK